MATQNCNNCINYPKSCSNLYENQNQLTKIPNNEKIHDYTPPPPNHHRLLYNETNMIHNKMERVEAERLLKPMEVGDFLLRKRNEGNLALSLRSIEGNFFK